MSADSGRDGVPTEKVHVRQLGVVDTVRWSWEVLNARRELAWLTFGYCLCSVLPVFGVTSSPDPSAAPAVAPWVGPFYLLYFLAAGVLFGAYFLTADDAVVERVRPLGSQLRAALRRLPALVLAGLLAFAISAVGLVVLVVPGLYLAARFVPALPAIVVDGEGPFGGLSAGWRASSENVWKLFVVGVVGVALCLGLAFVWASFGLLGPVLSSVLAAGVFPLLGLALGHLYLEQRRNQ